MAIPSVSDLTLPLLCLSNKLGEWGFGDTVPRLADQFELSEPDRSESLDSGVNVFYNRVAWAAFGLKEAGLIESPSRGVYRITGKGRELLVNPPKRLTRSLLRKMAGGTEPTETDTESGDDKSPEERIRDAHKETQRALADTLLQRLTTWTEDKQKRGALFEKVVVDLFEAMGYGRGGVLGRSGDGGIDGVIQQDRLGLDRIYVQAKCWVNPVQARDIRDFIGAVHSKGFGKGIFVTTSKFSGDTSAVLGSTRERIEFIDGHTLAQLMIEHGIGVKEERRYSVKRVDNDYFEPTEGVRG